MTCLVELRCRECGKPHPLAAVAACSGCWGALEPFYDLQAARRSLTREALGRRPADLWRYRELLPAQGEPEVGVATGPTPLLPAPRLARALGLTDLALKHEASCFPTHSFKDRLVAVALAQARALGFDTAACSSTGNLARSLAAAAARRGLHAVILVPEDRGATALAAAAAFGPTVVAVRGGYDRANRLTAQLSDHYPWAFVNVNLRPFYAEGAKTIAFEIAEQRGFRLPGHVVAPMASGGLLVKLDQAFRELAAVGLVDEAPVAVHGAQPSGCNPIVAALRGGEGVVKPVRPATIVKSLALGDPADGAAALAAIRRTGGAAEDPTDEESLEGVRLLARTEGLLTEPAGGTVVAAAQRLASRGAFADGGCVVLVIPASARGASDEPPAPASAVIDGRLEEFQAFWSEHQAARSGGGREPGR